MNIGKKLLEIRLASGLTQRELAKYFKRTQSTISHYEKDLYQPSPSVLVLYLKLAKKHQIEFSFSNL